MPSSQRVFGGFGALLKPKISSLSFNVEVTLMAETNKVHSNCSTMGLATT